MVGSTLFDLTELSFALVLRALSTTQTYLSENFPKLSALATAVKGHPFVVIVAYYSRS
jgi:hypothetical protein